MAYTNNEYRNQLLGLQNKRTEVVRLTSGAYWADAALDYEDDDGYRTFVKDGYHCWCAPGDEPGDERSRIYRDNTLKEVGPK